jgi:hypothetical protein
MLVGSLVGPVVFVQYLAESNMLSERPLEPVAAAVLGAGFAALETGLYALARVETVGVVLGVLWFRALLSPFTHGTWTAIGCATIWRERAVGWRRGAWKIAAACGAAIVLHGRGIAVRWMWPASAGRRALVPAVWSRAEGAAPISKTVTHLSRYC